MALPLSDDAKWIIGTLLVIATVVIAVGTTSAGLGRTVATRADLEDLATKSDLEDLATSADVETLRVQLDATTQRLEATVDRLDTTVTRLDSTVDRLGGTVDRLDSTVDRLDATTAAVRTVIGTTLPAIFACMVDLDAMRAGRNDAPVPGDVDRVSLSEICGRLKAELAAVETPLVPRLPE